MFLPNVLNCKLFASTQRCFVRPFCPPVPRRLPRCPAAALMLAWCSLVLGAHPPPPCGAATLQTTTFTPHPEDPDNKTLLVMDCQVSIQSSKWGVSKIEGIVLNSFVGKCTKMN